MEVGEVEGACEFPGLDGAAVGDSIAFEEARFVFNVVTGPADRDR
jgi:hypothetical protein